MINVKSKDKFYCIWLIEFIYTYIRLYGTNANQNQNRFFYILRPLT